MGEEVSSLPFFVFNLRLDIRISKIQKSIRLYVTAYDQNEENWKISKTKEKEWTIKNLIKVPSLISRMNEDKEKT